MILFKKAIELRDYLEGKSSEGLQTGFVPTMGALHQGHISLISTSKKQTDLTICSIFVNPTQFNNPSDFSNYPITLERDIWTLEKNGVDILFCPAASEMYPNGTNHLEQYDLGYLETILEGKYRPGHFQGVCQVMHRLIDIIQPTHLFMGEKDYQQCMVIKKLFKLIGSKIIFQVNPTWREADGLAMSSRNMRLNASERKKATAIYKALILLKNEIKPGNLEPILANAREILLNNDFTIDYVEIAESGNLEIIHNWDGEKKIIALIAAFQHETRLIDNMLLLEE